MGKLCSITGKGQKAPAVTWEINDPPAMAGLAPLGGKSDRYSGCSFGLLAFGPPSPKLYASGRQAPSGANVSRWVVRSLSNSRIDAGRVPNTADPNNIA